MRRGFFSSFGLKRIAVASMVIDHIGSFLLRALMAPYRVEGMLVVNQDSPAALRQLMLGREICDILGAIAFPIFCFLIVEGFLHTRDRLRYGRQMLWFALLSEIPYTLAHYQSFFSLRLQNVMFTLACAILTLLLVSKAEKKGRTRQEVDEVARWLTGYSQAELEGMLERPVSYGDFFQDAPELNENRKLIKGVVCGVRIEDIEEPLMQEIRYLDKLVDELARGKAMDKILRK